MNRRQFCMGMGSSAALLASRWAGHAAWGAATTMPAFPDLDPAGGFSTRPLKQLLFFDYRHILPNDLHWRTVSKESISLYDPAGDPVPVYADRSDIAYGIRLEARPATKEARLDQGAPGPVHYDSGLYRSWGIATRYASPDSRDPQRNVPVEALTIRYGESKDGYEWSVRDVCEVKPPATGITLVDGPDFFVDPQGSPQERYKAIFSAKPLSGVPLLRARYSKVHPRYRDHRLEPEKPDGLMGCLYGLVSPDGLNWTLLPEPLLINKGDTDNAAYYDEFLGKYVIYTRLYWMSRRMIARAESDDFRHWSPVEPVVQPLLDDPLNSDLYTNSRTSYPGEPSYHLMFPIHYYRDTQTSVIPLYSSIDGIRWHRVPGGPVLSNGAPDTWDGAFIGCARHLVPLGKDRVGIRYWGTGYPHKYPRWSNLPTLSGGAWATWPRGRLSALVADEDGQFSTFESPLPGQTLKLNVRVRKAGMLKVGVKVDNEGGPGRSVEDCDPIVGDHLEYTVTWKGDSDVRAAPGSVVRLFFKMHAAELFAAEWV